MDVVFGLAEAGLVEETDFLLFLMLSLSPPPVIKPPVEFLLLAPLLSVTNESGCGAREAERGRLAPPPAPPTTAVLLAEARETDFRFTDPRFAILDFRRVDEAPPT